MYDKRKGIRKSEEEKKWDCVHPRARLAGTGDWRHITPHYNTNPPNLPINLMQINFVSSQQRAVTRETEQITAQWANTGVRSSYLITCSPSHLWRLKAQKFDNKLQKSVNDKKNLFFSKNNSNNVRLTPVVSQCAVGTLGRFKQGDDHHAYIFSKF